MNNTNNNNNKKIRRPYKRGHNGLLKTDINIRDQFVQKIA